MDYKSPDASFIHIWALKSQILSSGVTEISFQISVLPFTSYVAG